MYIYNRRSVIINESKKEADEYIKDKELTDEQKDFIYNFLYKKLHATKYLINFIKYYLVDGTSEKSIIEVVNWLKGNKQAQFLPNKLEDYEKLEYIVDDIKRLEGRERIKKLYDYLKMDERGCPIDTFTPIAKQFLELDKDTRTQFTPLKYFRLNKNIAYKDILKAIKSFIEGMYDPNYIENTRKMVYEYVKNGIATVVYDINEEDNNKLVFVINLENENEDIIKSVTSTKWCINYSYKDYRKGYLNPKNSLIIVHDFNLPSTMDDSLFGIVLDDKGKIYSTGACQNKANSTTSLEEISHYAHIPYEYLQLQDFEKERISNYIKNFKNIFAKFCKDNNAVVSTDIKTGTLLCLFGNVDDVQNVIDKYGVSNRSAIVHDPFLTYSLYINNGETNIYYGSYNADNELALPVKKELIKVAINKVNEVLDSSFNNAIDFFDEMKKFYIAIKPNGDLDSDITLYIDFFIDFVNKKISGFADKLNYCIYDNLVRLNYKSGDISKKILLFFFKEKKDLYTVNLSVYYWLNKNLDKMSLFLDFLDNLYHAYFIHNYIDYPSMVECLYNKEKNIDTVCKFLDLFIKREVGGENSVTSSMVAGVVSGILLNHDIIKDLDNFDKWLILYNKLNEVLLSNDLTSFIESDIFDDIDLVRKFISDDSFITYIKGLDMSPYDLYKTIKEDNISDIDKSQFAEFLVNTEAVLEDDIDLALVYKYTGGKKNELISSISNGELNGEYYVLYNSLQDACDDAFGSDNFKAEDYYDLFDNYGADYGADYDWKSWNYHANSKIITYLYFYLSKKGFVFTNRIDNINKIESEINAIIRGDYENEDVDTNPYDDFDYDDFQSDLSSIIGDCQSDADSSKYYDKNIEKLMEFYKHFDDGSAFKEIEVENEIYSVPKNMVNIKDIGYCKVKEILNDNKMIVIDDGKEYTVPTKVLNHKTIFKIDDSFMSDIIGYDDSLYNIKNNDGDNFGYKTLITLYIEEKGNLNVYNGGNYGIQGNITKENFAERFIEHEFTCDISDYYDEFVSAYPQLFNK